MVAITARHWMWIQLETHVGDKSDHDVIMEFALERVTSNVVC